MLTYWCHGTPLVDAWRRREGPQPSFGGACSTLPAHSEPPCRLLLLIVLALRMWPPKGGLYVAHRPRFRCRSKLQSLGVVGVKGGQRNRRLLAPPRLCSGVQRVPSNRLRALSSLLSLRPAHQGVWLVLDPLLLFLRRSAIGRWARSARIFTV